MFKEKIEEIVGSLSKELKTNLGDNLTSLVLFGSVARGDLQSDSDIDLLIICQKLPKLYSERQAIIREATPGARKQISNLVKEGYYIYLSPIIKSEEQAKYHSPLYLDMTEDSKILYDRNNFFHNILKEIRFRLQELGSKKIFLSDGSWYWDLKPDYKYGEVFEI